MCVACIGAKTGVSTEDVNQHLARVARDIRDRGAGGVHLLGRISWRSRPRGEMLTPISWRRATKFRVEDPALPSVFPPVLLIASSNSHRVGRRGAGDEAHSPRCAASRLVFG